MEAAIMTDLKLDAEKQLGYDIAQRASEPDACGRWAHVLHTTDGPDRDPRLWPRDRGPAEGAGYRVSVLTTRTGLLKILLCRSGVLSAMGVDIDTQVALLAAEQMAWLGADVPAQILTPGQVDQVVQVGLFGEVLFS
jgi:hypothetical protein